MIYSILDYIITDNISSINFVKLSHFHCRQDVCRIFAFPLAAGYLPHFRISIGGSITRRNSCPTEMYFTINIIPDQAKYLPNLRINRLLHQFN